MHYSRANVLECPIVRVHQRLTRGTWHVPIIWVATLSNAHSPADFQKLSCCLSDAVLLLPRRPMVLFSSAIRVEKPSQRP